MRPDAPATIRAADGTAAWRVPVWAAIPLLALLCSCVSRTYQPGPPDSPFHQLRLGQSYSQMTQVLGEPDQSLAVDHTVRELWILCIPVWGLAEFVWNFHPAAMQVYTYRHWGTVTLGDENQILRVEAFPDETPGRCGPGG